MKPLIPTEDLAFALEKGLKFRASVVRHRGDPRHPRDVWEDLLSGAALDVAYERALAEDALERAVFIETPSGLFRYWTSKFPARFTRYVLRHASRELGKAEAPQSSAVDGHYLVPADDLAFAAEHGLTFCACVKHRRGGRWEDSLANVPIESAYERALSDTAFERAVFVVNPNGRSLYWSSRDPDVFNSDAIWHAPEHWREALECQGPYKYRVKWEAAQETWDFEAPNVDEALNGLARETGVLNGPARVSKIEGDQVVPLSNPNTGLETWPVYNMVRPTGGDAKLLRHGALPMKLLPVAKGKERLIQVLHLLASPAEVQAQPFPDFVVVADELALLFDNEVTGLKSAGEFDHLPPELRATLGDIDSRMDAMGSNEAAWTLDALRWSEDWRQIRDWARAALVSVGETPRVPRIDWVTFIQGG